MKIVIVGDGKVGYTLTEQLSSEGHDVVVIDSNAQKLKNSLNVLDVMGVEGNGASMPVQKEAGVDKADILIAATSGDEINILCCLVAKKLGAKHTVARVRNPEYSEQLLSMKEELGLSMTINPEFAAADEISRMLRFPAALKVDTFARGRVELIELKVREDGHLRGLALKELYQKFQVKVLVCAVRRGEEIYIPSGDFVLEPGDRISITASRPEMEKFFKMIGLNQQKVKSVMIVGGGRIAYYLACQLIASGMQVKIIEQNEERCRRLCELLPEGDIIHGDGTSQELLREEGIDSADAFIALTDIDEENIIIAMYAGLKKVGRIAAKVNRLSLLEILSHVGVDSIISPKMITAAQIIRYVRAMQNSLGSNVETLYKIVNNRVEALEFRVRENASFLGVTLKDLELKNELLIACIVRKGKIIIPSGNDTIELNDSVIVVTANQKLQDLNDILK